MTVSVYQNSIDDVKTQLSNIKSNDISGIKAQAVSVKSILNFKSPATQMTTRLQTV